MKITFLGDVFLQEDADWRSGLPKELQGDALVLNFEYVYDDGTLGDKDAAEGKINLKGRGNPFRNFQGCKVACLANNHSLDYSDTGCVSTIGFLDSHSVQSVGLWHDGKRNAFAKISDKISVSAYLQGHMRRSSNSQANWREEVVDEGMIVEDGRIAKAAGVEFHVVYLHWGSEFMPVPWPNQVALAHRLVDSGVVDMVIGMHPHCRQPWEKYKGKYIFYSLGNSVFAHYRDMPSFFKGGVAQAKWAEHWGPESNTSYAVTLDVENLCVHAWTCCYDEEELKVLSCDEPVGDLRVTRMRCGIAVFRRIKLGWRSFLHGKTNLARWHLRAAFRSYKSFMRTVAGISRGCK